MKETPHIVNTYHSDSWHPLQRQAVVPEGIREVLEESG
jgi:hypothetical protein